MSGLKAYFSQLNNLTSFSSIDHDEDQDESYHINCQYYSVDDFQSISKSNSPSFLHLNISSLEKHFSEFLALSKLLNHSFDIMGISETRLTPSSSMNIDLLDYSFTTIYQTPCRWYSLFLTNYLMFRVTISLTPFLLVVSLNLRFVKLNSKTKKISLSVAFINTTIFLFPNFTSTVYAVLL